ncbi:2-methoxy-6-polyprenyl-1,4-benzoquinol methylase, mitochondrial [Cupriavidus yeoncheonensis]|uniref:2-methoxy-6-polyprenyl-1,4-benzoquinol methylase, mitochondrial n=1 Tax=Cupriavidus yeoncheonensis TaxID=1462994 RepID=A0A916MW20_9BURK|nr:class I SAM-dependent methyltransferase [Cupriavidus yeoncheonensis]CAG2146949.1 2-methoxy-6-polyprenyl-1,4-benzoquinol methylase, mitochondrial [Cupriavidus yeoncheonensis]
MPQSDSDKFTGAVPELYERYLVPMIFAPYAADLARRAAALQPARVLEMAAGTGALTRELARLLPPQASIVATDLNPPMLERARTVGTSRPVDWQVANAMQLPFDDGSFDLVVCQFGVMFFPDKPAAFAEARRVLAPGGTLLFNVWDRIEDNHFTAIVCEALASMFPDDPPQFMTRTPHGYHRQAEIAGHLRQGGFLAAPAMETLPETSTAESARIAAVALCQGTPLRPDLESRGPDALQRATDLCEQALAQAFGTGAIEARMQAHVVAVVA